MKQIKCPCCNGVGTVEEGPPIPLPVMQARIYDIMRRQKNGITNADLTTKVYEDHADGGPDFAAISVRVMIYRINGKLKAYGQQIHATNKGLGAVLYLKRFKNA